MSSTTQFLSLRLPPLASLEVDGISELPPDEMYVDADFIPASVAVSVDPLKVEALSVAQWRPSGDALPDVPLFIDGAQVDLACNQEFDDTWLAGAMALVATRPELLSHLFGSTEYLDRGILTLRLFKHGAWHPVTIDTMLPCRADGAPSFICAGQHEVLWPSLLTKAMAKLHGSYAALEGGDVADALVDLTAGHVAREPLGQPAEHDPSFLDGVWRAVCKGLKRGTLQGGLTAHPKDKSDAAAKALHDMDAADGEGEGEGEADAEADTEDDSNGLLPNRLYPILFAREPLPGLRLICVRDPWLEPPPPTPTMRAWAPLSAEWARHPDIADMLLPLSDEVGRCIWMELPDFTRCFSELLTVSVAGAATEAVICEGTWHEQSAGGPRALASWCINPQYWVTVAKDTTLLIEISQPDVRLAPIRHASSSTAQQAASQFGGAIVGGAAPDDPFGAEDGAPAGYFPMSLNVVRGGAPSTMDYGRVWHHDNEKTLIGETEPASQRTIGMSVQLSAERSYCIVACGPAGHSSPFVLRLQSETPFTLKQAQPATVARLSGAWDAASAGGPRTSKSWTLNPQYWLMIRPPPTGAALARVRLVLESHTPTAEQAANSKRPQLVSASSRAHHNMPSGPTAPDVGLSVFRGEFNRDRFGRSRASSSASGQASPPPSRPGTAPPARNGKPNSPRGGERPTSRGSPRGSPSKDRPQSQGGDGGAKGVPGNGFMEVGGHEQLVEFNSIDRNGDGIVSAAEMETYRKMRGASGANGVSSSQAATLPSIAEGQGGGGQLAHDPANGGVPMEELLPPAGPSPLTDGSTLDLAPVGSYNLAFGLPVRDTFESQPQRRHQADKSELLTSLPAEGPTSTGVLRLDPGLPYVVSVHTARPAELADYSLAAYSDAVLSLSLIEATTQRVLRGSWRTSNAGGSHIESAKWHANPMYAIYVRAPTTVDITLERPANKWRGATKTATLESMMGFYVLRGDGIGQRLKAERVDSAVLHQTTFLPAHEVRASLHLEPLDDGAPYIIMPATFGAGQRGPFSLGINTDYPCAFEALPEVNAPVPRGEGSP